MAHGTGKRGRRQHADELLHLTPQRATGEAGALAPASSGGSPGVLPADPPQGGQAEAASKASPLQRTGASGPDAGGLPAGLREPGPKDIGDSSPPPDYQGGGERGSGTRTGGATVGVHWLDVMLDGGPDEVLQTVGAALGQDQGVFRDCGVSGFWGRSWRTAGVFIGAENRGGGDGVLLSLAGEAWELYGQGRMLALVKSLWRRVRAVTRVDVAFDGVGMAPREAYDAWLSGQWVSRAGANFVDNERGQAFWAGKLLAGCSQVCIYNERGANRLEFRTRRREWGKALVEAAMTGEAETLGRAAKGGVRAFLGGSWGPLDEWLASTEPLARTPAEGKDMGAANDADFESIIGRATVWLLRHTWAEFCDRITLAGKYLDGATLARYGVDYRTIGDTLGRVAPRRYTGEGAEGLRGDG